MKDSEKRLLLMLEALRQEIRAHANIILLTQGKADFNSDVMGVRAVADRNATNSHFPTA